MHVVVVGCGRVGSALARALVEVDHTVGVVDRNRETFERLGEGFPGRTVTGVGFDRDTLVAAGIEEASAVAAVTSGDNTNILVARIARETFGVERVVARIYDPRRAAIYQRLGIATVASVAWTTERMLRRVLPDVPAVEWIDPSAKVAVVERVVPAGWAGRPARMLELPGAAHLVLLSRYGVGQLPGPDTVLQEGDVVYVAVTEDALDRIDVHLASGSKGGH